MGNSLDDIKKNGKTSKIELRSKIKKKPQQNSNFVDFKKILSVNASPKLIDIKGKTERVSSGKNIFFLFKKYNFIELIILGIFFVLFINILAIYENSIAFKSQIFYTTKGAFSSIIKGKENLLATNFEEAELSFKDANEKFIQAAEKLSLIREALNKNDINSSLSKIIDGIWGAGKEITEAGIIITKSLENIKKLLPEIIKEKQKISLTERIAIEFNNLSYANQILLGVVKKLNILPKSLVPSQYDKSIEIAKEKLKEATTIFTNYEKYIPLILNLLGDDLPQKYLVLLQNSGEIRPTGGFIGSYAIIDFNDGYLTNFSLRDIYDLDNNFHEKIEPPEELKVLTDTWRLRDSNYSPDFAISAAKAAWFLQKEGGPSVDNVIAIDQNLIADLINIIGPIKLNGFKKELESKDFSFILSVIVESKIQGEKNPKIILNEISSIIFEKIKNPEFSEQIAEFLFNALEQKRIQIWSKNEENQKMLENLKIAGRMASLNEKEDYFNLIETSVSGNKSDNFLKREIEHITYIDRDGTILNRITLYKKHLVNNQMLEIWEKSLEKYGLEKIFTSELKNILGDGENKTIEKFYVPKGSRILMAEGIDINNISEKNDQELDKTFFSFLCKIKPGEEKKISITYKIPFKLEFNQYDNYFIRIQKQSGLKANLTKKIILDEPLIFFDKYPKTPEQKTQIFEFKNSLDKDLHFGTVIGI